MARVSPYEHAALGFALSGATSRRAAAIVTHGRDLARKFCHEHSSPLLGDLIELVR